MPSICPDVELQLQADDTVIYVHVCSSEVIASKITRAIRHVTKRLYQSCLMINVITNISAHGHVLYFNDRN